MTICSSSAAGVLGLIADWLVDAGPAYAAVLREVTRAREAADDMDEDAAIAAIAALSVRWRGCRANCAKVWAQAART